MSISQSMSAALSGLRATTRGINLVSTNVANATTEGYGVRTLNQGTRPLGGSADGVFVYGVTRQVDQHVLSSRRQADAELAGQSLQSGSLGRVEDAFGRIGEGSTLADKVSAVENALISATGDPASDARLGAVTDRLSDLVGAVTDTARQIQSERERAELTISQGVELLNHTLVEVDRLNEEIMRTDTRGNDISGLVDQRQQLIDGVSELVSLNIVQREKGTVAIFTKGGETLLDTKPRTVGFQSAGIITADMDVASGALGKLSVDGQTVPTSRPWGAFGGGSLEAAFILRDEKLPEAQADLDVFTADLIRRTSDTAVDASVTGPGTGLIGATTGTIDLVNPKGLSERLTLNAAIDPETGNPSLLRDGLGAVAAGPISDATRLTGWLDVFQRAEQLNGSGPPNSLTDHAAQMVSDQSAKRLRADQTETYATAKHASLKEQELADGVDTDLEMQKLLVLENAYAANARVIQAADEMLNRLLEL